MKQLHIQIAPWVGCYFLKDFLYLGIPPMVKLNINILLILKTSIRNLDTLFLKRNFLTRNFFNTIFLIYF